MMARRTRRVGSWPVALALAAVCALIIGCAASAGEGRVLRGTVSDAGSGMPVYKARVEFGGRATTLYTSRDFRLTHLRGGEGVLAVEADGYEPWRRPVELRGRETKIEIALRGVEVPGLAGILAWAAWETEALRIDIRLTDSAGATLQHFPSLPFSAEARLAVNAGSEKSPRPGALLFEGPVDVRDDPGAGLDRLTARIPRASIAPVPADAHRGMLDFTLTTPQGKFSWTRGDVPLGEGK